MNAGIKLLCTAHGRDTDELRRKPATAALMQARVFERFVVLSAPWVVTGIYDIDGEPIAAEMGRAVREAGAALGLYYSGLEEKRAQDLSEFKKALLILSSEIEFVAL